MTKIRTVIGENNGAVLEARIFKKEHEPYSVEYYIDGKFKMQEEFKDVSVHFVEDAVENWIQGIKILHG